MTNGTPQTPRSKAEFVEKFADQMSGFLLSAFAAEENVRVDMAAKGRFMMHRLQSVKPLLEAMYCFIVNEPLALPAPIPEPSMNDQVNALLKRFRGLPAEQQKLVAEKLTKAFTAKPEPAKEKP